MNVYAIVLAAGNSRRFGRNKLLTMWNGKPLYQYLIDRLENLEIPFCKEKIVVSQYEEIIRDVSKRGFVAVENKAPEKGISHSIFLGLQRVLELGAKKDDGVCFFVCDQPYLEKNTITTFCEQYVASGKGIGVVGTKKVLGNPVAFRLSYLKELQALSGDVGGKKIVREHLEDTFIYEVEDRQLEDVDYDKRPFVIIRGGGDLASGVIYRLYKEGYRLLVLETSAPACIRRQVSFGEAVYDRVKEIEGVKAVRIRNTSERILTWESGYIPVYVDEDGNSIWELSPDVVVDAILAKKNLGTCRKMAPLTIGLGPGFEGGVDVDAVIETMRGESLGKVYRNGFAIPNTGVPGMIGGFAKERVIHAPADGAFHLVRLVGDVVSRGEMIAYVGDTPIEATIDGILRGAIREGFQVRKGLKIMDIDPRLEESHHCFTISDKARTIADRVYEVIRTWEEQR